MTAVIWNRMLLDKKPNLVWFIQKACFIFDINENTFCCFISNLQIRKLPEWIHRDIRSMDCNVGWIRTICLPVSYSFLVPACHETEKSPNHSRNSDERFCCFSGTIFPICCRLPVCKIPRLDKITLETTFWKY